MGEEFLASRREPERGTLKEPDTRLVFQGGHLATYGWLLDTIRDVPDRRADAPMLGDVIE
jgi:hypothetical protein